ncbi:hypothetical protein DIPPA_27688 [Diplonema papillatum]|nr:hypothetical protein DIPPA_27688 [Diplonema papillatum]
MSVHRRATWGSVLAAASADSYFGGMQYLVLPFLAVYLFVIACYTSTTLPLEAATRLNATEGPQTLLLLYEAPDALFMVLRDTFSGASLSAHSWAGIALVVTAHAQKHTIPGMACGRGTARVLHRYVFGPMTLVLASVMAYYGYDLRRASDFPAFNQAMVAFVAPWIVLVPTVVGSARIGYKRTHAVLGDCLVKATVAVPLARTLGAFLQRWPADVFSHAEGYYLGIFVAAFIVAAWTCLDAYLFVRRESRSRHLKAC